VGILTLIRLRPSDGALGNNSLGRNGLTGEVTDSFRNLVARHLEAPSLFSDVEDLAQAVFLGLSLGPTSLAFSGRFGT
jgi:hypothetical protein